MNQRIMKWLFFALIFALFVPSAIATATSTVASPYIGPELTISEIDVERLPTVAYNWKHHEYLVVWHDSWVVNKRDIRARRVTVGGEILAEFTIHDNPAHDSAQPSVAYDPVHDRYLVVWIYDVSGNLSNWDIYGRFIPWQGPDPGLQAFPIVSWNTKQWNPKLVYGRAQEEFMVTWWNEHPTLPAYVSGKRISADGSGFPSGGGSDFTISHPSQPRVEPDISYNLARNEYLVVYSNGPDNVFGMRLRGDGQPLGGGEFGIAGWPAPEHHPRVAACRGPNQYLVVWQSDEGGNPAIYGRFVNGVGAVGNVLLIDDTTSPEMYPDVACDEWGAQYLVSWQTRYTNLKYGIWARMVQPGGAMSSQFFIQHAGRTTDRTNPAIAGGSSNYLVVWEHDRGGSRYSVHGRMVAPNVVFQPLLAR